MQPHLRLGWSWLFWFTAVLLGLGMETPVGIILSLVGLFGPMIAGIIGTYAAYGREGRRDYWRRVIDLKRIKARWYIPILLVAPVLMGLAALLG